MGTVLGADAFITKRDAGFENCFQGRVVIKDNVDIGALYDR
jgi:UDP-3-O-[3-hydroxymyristoyl] glucosamine N-acyltransferase